MTNLTGERIMRILPDERTNVLLADEAQEPQIGLWLGALHDSRLRTFEAIEGVSQDDLDADHPDTRNSIGTLLYHIAAIEADWLYAEVLTMDFPADVVALFPHEVRDKAGRLTPVRGVSLDDHLERLREVRELVRSTYGAMTIEDFFRVRVLPEYDVTPAWVIHHLLQHEAEHRGDIGVIRSWLRRGAPGQDAEA